VKISDLPFGIVDWHAVATTIHAGATGEAVWRTRELAGVRLRMLEYSAGYLADHWCSKGHFMLCLEGELITELEDGRRFTLRPGMSYHVADGAEAHRSSTRIGARLYVVD
jgi:hypothetical protein